MTPNFAVKTQLTLRILPSFSVLVCATALALLVLPYLTTGSDVFAAALTLDFMVVVPVLMYLFVVRPRHASPWILVPVFVCSYLVASHVLPRPHRGWLDRVSYVYVIPLVEVIVLAYIVRLARRAYRHRPAEGDMVTKFRSAARAVLSRRVADILTTECLILYYVFHRGRTNSPRFTLHKECGYGAVVGALSIVVIVETVAVHVLVANWSESVAWILTALSVYALLWILGDYRAIKARGMDWTTTHLALRIGLRWEADIPLQVIEAVEPSPKKVERSTNELFAALLGNPNVVIRLRRPIRIIRLYGFYKEVSTISLRVDRSNAFVDEWNQKIRSQREERGSSWVGV